MTTQSECEVLVVDGDACYFQVDWPGDVTSRGIRARHANLWVGVAELVAGELLVALHVTFSQRILKLQFTRLANI